MKQLFLSNGILPTVKKQEIIDQLGTLTDVEDHLQFATNILQRDDIPNIVRTEIRQYIDYIRKRCCDSNLYLAVIGEFSSGKSTFINALLRDDLLKTSALPTTAAAIKLRYGSDLQVEVRLKGSRSGIAKTCKDTKNITLPWLPGVKNLDTRGFIHALTANDQVAKDVVAMTITHPAALLAKGIVVIDTPGTNATHELHGEVTSKVVERVADAAIIIIPATVPLSQSLANFLRGSLHPFLHRCIFVVTQMDKIRQREQNDVLSNLCFRLVEQLGIKPPSLYACSAQVVLDDITGEEPIQPHLLVWKERFEQLENLMISRLSRERTLAISENVLRLLTRLFKQLDGHLRSQWEQYKQHQAAIEQEIISDLTSFTAQEQRICQGMLDDSISITTAKVNQCVEEHREKTVSEIYKAIFSAQDLEALGKVVQSGSEETLKQAQNELQRKLQDKIQDITQVAEQASHQFDRKFAEAYKRLQTLAHRPEISSNINDDVQLNTSTVVASMQSLNQEIDTKKGYFALGGAAAGAALGTAILPVVGTVVGGFLGLIASASLFSSLDKRKQQLWENLDPSLDSYFKAVKRQAQQAVESYGRSVNNALYQRIDKYMLHYKETVDKILQEQKSELQRLTDIQTTMQADLQEINRRRKSLSAQQQRLAATEST
ncbi:MAG: dynamin family protein [Rhizonema sp. PD37]|nr:dynamin family protein [Rhizonema sp. PD37]